MLSKVTARVMVRLAVTTDSRDPGPESGWKASILGCLRLELAKYIVLEQGSIVIPDGDSLEDEIYGSSFEG